MVRVNDLSIWLSLIEFIIGLLSVGFEKYGNEQELQKDPIHHLFQVYVRINNEKDELIEQQANAYFKRMEEGRSNIYNTMNTHVY